MGGVALRFCVVLGRVLMVACCCGSGCFGCICVVLELGGVTSSFRASESDVRHFSWVVWRCVFVWFWGVF